MNLLRGKSTRIYFSDNGTLSDITSEMMSFESPDKTFAWVAAQDALYMGCPHKFNCRYVQVKTANTNASKLKAQYWNGNAWTDFVLLEDETAGFAQSGFVMWEAKRPEWTKVSTAAMTGLTTLPFTETADQLYWVKLTLDVDPSAFALSTIKFLLSDDRMLPSIYPEIMGYLPTGQTDFMKQHELAKDYIVAQLKRDGVIKYEEQLKNPDEWLMAASYRAIAIVLAPISGDERLAEVKKTMAADADRLLPRSAASIDTDGNEDLDDVEKSDVRGRVLELTR